jgi:hypothetical protein
VLDASDSSISSFTNDAETEVDESSFNSLLPTARCSRPLRLRTPCPEK